MKLDIALDTKIGSVPIYKQIIEQIRINIAKGIVKSGNALPPINELAEELKVNPNTVSKAYHELELIGVIEGQRGKGSFLKENFSFSSKEKENKLKEIIDRILIEASNYGLTLEDIKNYLIKEG